MTKRAMEQGLSELDSYAYKLINPEVYYRAFVARGVRPDGRELTDSKPTVIRIGTACAKNKIWCQTRISMMVQAYAYCVGPLTIRLVMCPCRCCIQKLRFRFGANWGHQSDRRDSLGGWAANTRPARSWRNRCCLAVLLRICPSQSFALSDVNVSISGVCGPEYTQQSKSSESYVVEGFLLQILQRYSSNIRCIPKPSLTLCHRCNVVDLTQLCIESGVAAWKVTIDVTFLSIGGCLLDVATAAVAAALLNMQQIGRAHV